MAVGRAAVECALAGQNAVMPVIVRDGDAPYRWHVDIAPLARIANHEKTMPKGFIRKDGYGITAAARRYLSPLVAGEAPPPFGRDGLPNYVTPPMTAVPRRLPAWRG
jgi:6-phosphofructokinase 1